MSWATKYRMEFADNLGVVWRKDIQKDGYLGSVIEMRAAGNPLEFEFYGGDDIFEQNILGSKCVSNVIASVDFEYDELFTSNNFEWKVLIYHGSTLYWSGYILANNHQEPYDCPPYPLSITATDGLGLLSEYEFKDIGYTDRQTFAQVIYDILALVGITTFTEYVSLYESTMATLTSSSPLDQCGFNPELYAEDNCYDALESILTTFNAAIRQDQGKVSIYRIVDQSPINGETLYGRIYTSGTSHTATTKALSQYFNRTTNPSYFRDTEGGSKMIAPLVKVYYINQDYGNKISIFKNYDFIYDNFEYGTDWEIEGWIRYGTDILPLPVASDAGGDGVFINTADTVLGTTYLLQEVKNLVSTKFIFDIESSGVTIDGNNHAGSIYVRIYNTDGATTQYFTGTTWTATPTNILLESGTFTPDLNFSRHIYSATSVPMEGVIGIILIAAQSTGGDVYAAFKNVKMSFVNSDNYIVEGIGYTVTHSNYGQTKEKEYRLGEGPGLGSDAIQYKGVLNMFPAGHEYGNTSREWTSMYYLGAPMPLMKLIAGEYGGQYSRVKQVIDIPVIETNSTAYLSLIGNIQDDLNKYDTINRYFAITASIYTVKMRQWDLTLCEIIKWRKPVPVSAIVDSPDVNKCIVTFDIALDEDSVPAAGDFVFLPAGDPFSPGTVTGVSISGAVLTLTLASNALTGVSYEVSYTAPATNKLVSVENAGVDTIIDYAVTNNI